MGDTVKFLLFHEYHKIELDKSYLGVVVYLISMLLHRIKMTKFQQFLETIDGSPKALICIENRMDNLETIFQGARCQDQDLLQFLIQEEIQAGKGLKKRLRNV